jgi:site-specific recombinase XerD
LLLKRCGLIMGRYQPSFSGPKQGLLNGHQPMRNVQEPKASRKAIRILGDEEVARLLALLDKPSVKKRTLYVAFSLMYRLGLRISEVCDLRLSDLNLKQGWLLVRGKAKRERRLPVRSSLEGMLRS